MLGEAILPGVQIGLYLVAIIFSVGFVFAMLNRIPWPSLTKSRPAREPIEKKPIDWVRLRKALLTPKGILLLIGFVVCMVVCSLPLVALLYMLNQVGPGLLEALLGMLVGSVFFAGLYMAFPRVDWEFVFLKSAIIGFVTYLWVMAMVYSVIYYALGETRLLWGMAIATGWLSSYLLNQFMLFIERSWDGFDRLAISAWAKLPQVISRGRLAIAAKKS